MIVGRKLSKDYILKVGIDVGGGYLKVCLNIIEKVTECKVKKINIKYKDEGVNKLFIICLVENEAESHSNLEKILNIFELNDL